MTRRRGRNGRSEDLFPEDRVLWARELWKDRLEVAMLPGGAWMLREAVRFVRTADVHLIIECRPAANDRFVCRADIHPACARRSAANDCYEPLASVAAFALAGCQTTLSDVDPARKFAPDAIDLTSAESTNNQSIEIRFSAFVTGYSYWDNTPPGSSAIARPVVHRGAGGTGTYRDPITIAVGHQIRGTRSLMDYPTGTRFYLESLRKYAIVEDLCGDGNRPQNGPCHTGRNGLPWLDIYVGGRSVGNSASNSCMNSITGVYNVVRNPSPGLPVRPGEIALSTCRGL